MASTLRFLPSGDTALVVELGLEIDRRLSTAVLRLAERIGEAGLAGVVEVVPTFRSLLIHYDPTVTSAQNLSQRIAELTDDPGHDRLSGQLWRIPVCHDGNLAPDLEEVAVRVDLSPREVVARHCSQDYHVYMLGFLPGYPYMGDVPPSLRLPRRENPRVKVPAGSVAIATTMTAVYTYESPGGWHLIGRTPVSLFDLRATPPALLRPGDRVVFEPVTRTEYERLDRAVAKDEYHLTPEPVA